MIEIRRFSDFLTHIQKRLELLNCPYCNSNLRGQIFTGFNMNQVGKAIFQCTNTQCHFHNNHITVEAVQ